MLTRKAHPEGSCPTLKHGLSSTADTACETRVCPTANLTRQIDVNTTAICILLLLLLLLLLRTAVLLVTLTFRAWPAGVFAPRGAPEGGREHVSTTTALRLPCTATRRRSSADGRSGQPLCHLSSLRLLQQQPTRQQRPRTPGVEALGSTFVLIGKRADDAVSCFLATGWVGYGVGR